MTVAMKKVRTYGPTSCWMEVSLTFLFTIGIASRVAFSQEYSNTSAICANGQVIRREGVCDQVVDCEDGSDERYNGSGFKCILLRSTMRTTNARCLLLESMVRDNVTDCSDSSDLCFDQNKQLNTSRCFQCLNGNETISLTQVCDGTIDCSDLSDECTCVLPSTNHTKARKLLRNPICDQLKYVQPNQTNPVLDDPNCKEGQIVCKAIDTKRPVCVEPEDICNNINDCPLGDDEKYCYRINFVCSGENETTGAFCDGRIDCPNFDDECNDNCWLPNEFCESVVGVGEKDSGLNCDTDNETFNATSNFTIDAVYVCDGKVDCEEGSIDEAYCLPSTHFYCSNNPPLFVNRTDYLDKKRDCSFGSDECGDQVVDSKFELLTSRDAIIRSVPMVCIVFIFGIMALVGNAAVFRHTFKELWSDGKFGNLGKLAKCNRILVANLAISDFLMGLYLISIGIVSVISDGRYCVNDRYWRSGLLCSTLGFICQLASQTSVLSIVLMTSYRLYGTLHPFRVERSNVVYSSLVSCVAVWVISISFSIVPLVDSFADYFDSKLWVPLPMVPSDVISLKELKELVTRMSTVTYNKTEPIVDYAMLNMIGYLQSIGIKGIRDDWNLNSVRPYGYYNSYPLCVPNFYPHAGDSAHTYSTVMVIFDALSIIYIAVSYFVIYKASSRPAVRKSVRLRSKQWRRDNKSMQKKILLLVITDVACWLPICVIAFVNAVNPLEMRRDIIGLTGGLLLPINSAVNPLIYSSSFWQVLESVCSKLGRRDHSFQDFVKSQENLVTSHETSDIKLRQVERQATESSYLKDDSESSSTYPFNDNTISPATRRKKVTIVD